MRGSGQYLSEAGGEGAAEEYSSEGGGRRHAPSLAGGGRSAAEVWWGTRGIQSAIRRGSVGWAFVLSRTTGREGAAHV